MPFPSHATAFDMYGFECSESYEGTYNSWRAGVESVFKLAIKENGMLLRFADDALKGDAEIVHEAVSQNGMAIEHASPELRDDLEVVTRALTTVDKFAPPRFLELPAVSPLRFVSPRLLLNREVALMACTHAAGFGRDGMDYVPPALKNDEEFVAQCLRGNGENLRFLSAEARSEKRWVEMAMQQDARALIFAPAFWGDELLLLEAAKEEADILFMLHDRSGGEWSVEGVSHSTMMALAATSEENMQETSRFVNEHPEFAVLVAEKYPGRLNLLHPCQYENREVLMTLAAVDGNTFLWTSTHSEDVEVATIAVCTTPDIFKKLSMELRDSLEVATVAVSQRGAYLKFASQRLQGHRELVVAATLSCTSALIYAAESLRSDVEFVREIMCKTLEADRGHRARSFEFYSYSYALKMLNDPVIRACSYVIDYKNFQALGLNLTDTLDDIVADLGRTASFSKTDTEFDTAVCVVAKHVDDPRVQEAAQAAHAARYNPKDAAGGESRALLEWKSAAPLCAAAEGAAEPPAKRSRC